MAATTTIASVLCIALAIVVALANPRRAVNRAFALVLVVIGTYLLSVSFTIREGMAFFNGQRDSITFWFRANFALLAYLPLAVGMVSAAVSGPQSKARWRRLNILLGLGGVIATGLAMTPHFIYELPDRRIGRGLGYYIFSAMGCFVYIWCMACMLQQLPQSRGIKRLELNLVAWYSAGLGTMLVGLNAIGNYFAIAAIKNVGIFAVFVSSIFLGWSLFFRRIFDAREIALRVARQGFVIASTAFILLAVWHWDSLSVTIRLTILTISAAPVALLLYKLSEGWFYRPTEHRTAALRRQLLEAASKEISPPALRNALCEILARETSASFVVITSRDDSVRPFDPLKRQWEKGARALQNLEWATPESMDRRRPSKPVLEIQSLLSAEKASLILAIPRGSRSPDSLAIFGERRDGLPFTYPEIAWLLGLVELVDNILTRSRLVEQASLQAKMDHLAMMSRGLAHDLKNLITPISSFLVYTEGKIQCETTEAEVHAAAQRSIRVMGDYIRDALFFSTRLSPKFESFTAGELLGSIREIVAERARLREIELVYDLSFSPILVADRVLLQRLLVNLVTNAIDASPPGGTVRWHAAPSGPHMITIIVQDHGMGIPQESIDRIFEPYFTTKQFGEEVRGFGLGLTIAEKIALLHRGHISVSSQVGVGTTMTVELPLLPPHLRPDSIPIAPLSTRAASFPPPSTSTQTAAS